MKVSIVTPTFKAAKTLLTCCESVSRQCRMTAKGTPIEVEHILVDGKSEDGSVEIAQGFGTIKKILSEPDYGVYDGMNKGVRLADGDVIGILNADDFYVTRDVLSMVVDALEHSGAETCYGNVVYVDPQKPTRSRRVWHAGRFRRARFYHGWMPPHPAFFVRRSCYERFGLFRLDMGTAADYELMLRLLVREKVSCVWVPNLWVAMRAGGASNASWRSHLEANRMDRRAWRVNGLIPTPGFRIKKPARKVAQFFCSRGQLSALLRAGPSRAMLEEKSARGVERSS